MEENRKYPSELNVIGKSVYELIPAERIIFSEKEINELTSQAYRQILLKEITDIIVWVQKAIYGMILMHTWYILLMKLKAY